MYAYRCTLTARQRMRIVNCEGDADIADTDKCRWKIIPTVFYGFSRKNSFEQFQNMTTLGTEFNSISSVCSVLCMKLLSDELQAWHFALIRGQDTL